MKWYLIVLMVVISFLIGYAISINIRPTIIRYGIKYRLASVGLSKFQFQCITAPCPVSYEAKYIATKPQVQGGPAVTMVSITESEYNRLKKFNK